MHEVVDAFRAAAAAAAAVAAVGAKAMRAERYRGRKQHEQQHYEQPPRMRTVVGARVALPPLPRGREKEKRGIRSREMPEVAEANGVAAEELGDTRQKLLPQSETRRKLGEQGG